MRAVSPDAGARGESTVDRGRRISDRVVASRAEKRAGIDRGGAAEQWDSGAGAGPERCQAAAGAGAARLSSCRFRRSGAGGPFGGSSRSFGHIGCPSPSSSAAILVTSFLGLVNPLMLKLLTDEVIIGHHYDRLDLYVGLMIAIPIISGLIGLGQTYLNNVIGQHIMQDLRSALYAHLQRMPLRFFTETRTGEIQSRLSNDVGGIQSVVTDTAASVTSNVAVTISTIIAMLLFDWRLTVLSLGMLPFFLFLTFRVGKVRREVSTETQKSLAELSAVTEETLSVSGILLSKTFGQQAQSIRRFQAVNGRLARNQIRQAMVGRWFFMIIGTIFSITPALVYWLAGTLAAGGDSVCADSRHDRCVHDAPEPPVLSARAAPERPGRAAGLAGAVRSDLRIPRAQARDRGLCRTRWRSIRARSAAACRSGTCGVPLPADADSRRVQDRAAVRGRPGRGRSDGCSGGRRDVGRAEPR